MNYNVGILWGIYILVVLIFILIFLLILERYYYNPSYTTAFLIASIFGAVAVFIGIPWLDGAQMSNAEKAWLSVLLVVAFILPVFIIIYMVWVNSYKPICCEKSMKQKIKCNEDGICELKEQKIYQGRDKTTIKYE